LDGIRILDLSRFIAGPLCGMVLGDMGADVVKVERRVKGEDSRAVGPFVADESLYTLTYNRNKRGLTLDFRSADGQSLLRELIAEADVVIENFRAGTMEKLGCCLGAQPTRYYGEDIRLRSGWASREKALFRRDRASNERADGNDR
jgi:crotonobetainyl-CoA:carnitine CoA-transferase CaiB-like acyl-CoA transferase